MPDHVHLIIHFNQLEYNIGQVLKSIKLPVSRKALAFLRTEAPEWLPRLAQKRGNRTEYHFWQRGGGYDRNITEPRTLEQMIEYLHLNPVRKGLVQHAIDWKWSSARWFAVKTPGPLVVDQIPYEWTAGMTDA